MKTFYFTFGPKHKDMDGASLAGRYCPIRARDEDEAWAIMCLTRGRAWFSYYGEDEFKETEHFRELTPVSLGLIALSEEQSPRQYESFNLVLNEKKFVPTPQLKRFEDGEQFQIIATSEEGQDEMIWQGSDASKAASQWNACSHHQQIRMLVDGESWPLRS